MTGSSDDADKPEAALKQGSARAKRSATSATSAAGPDTVSDNVSAEELEQQSVKAFLAGVGTRVRAVRNLSLIHI